jgi:hypothetical protein
MNMHRFSKQNREIRYWSHGNKKKYETQRVSNPWPFASGHCERTVELVTNFCICSLSLILILFKRKFLGPIGL